MQKTIEIEQIGEVILARRKGTRHIRLSINGDKVRLSVPFGISETAALTFLAQKQDWIVKHRKPKNQKSLQSGDRIGRAHQLRFIPKNITRTSTKVANQVITIDYPQGLSVGDKQVQTAAVKASKKALQKEAEQLLPIRLRDLSTKTSAKYTSYKIKFLKSRWGSCSNRGEITLNSYLIQLDWALIDYVIFHELAHLKHHNHSDKFWSEVEASCPNYKTLRKQLKTKHTEVSPNSLA